MTLAVSIQHQLGAFALDVQFEAPRGVTALFGRSGAGKTTVVNVVAGLLQPDSGRVAVDDWVLFDTQKRLSLAPHQRKVGYVFQEGRLFPHMSVRQNLLYGSRVQRFSVDADHVAHVIAMLGIGALLERRPSALSGGEKQRVAIGRALLCAPKLLLLDEPLAALDDPRKAEILPYLERLRDDTDIPILYVSHSVNEIARLATTVVVLNDGKVQHAGTTEDILSDPTTVSAVGVREVGAVLDACLLAQHDDGLSELTAPGGRLFLPRVRARVGDILRVRIRAQDIILSKSVPVGLSALNVLKGQISSIRGGDGPGALVRISVGEAYILARITKRSAKAMGLEVGGVIYAIIKSVSIAQGDIGTTDIVV